MIIGTCGYGATGSSVITDLLREFSGIQVYDQFEFTYCYKVDGLQDLEHHLMKSNAKNISGDAAISRFLYAAQSIKTPFTNKPTNSRKFIEITHEFVDSLVQVKYKGMDDIDTKSGNILRNIAALGMKRIILPNIYEKRKGRACYLWPNRDMYVCVKPEGFYDKAQKYIKDILLAMGADTDGVVALDQPFEGNAPEQSFPFFDDPMAIIVDRDPRDLYLHAKYICLSRGRFMPRQNVEDFVAYYQSIRKGQKRVNSERILFLRFEDLIYNYDISVEKVVNFLAVKDHKTPRSSFDPARSISNTQLIRKYPNDIDEIRYIEEQLPEYLFHFEEYPDADIAGDPFFGNASKMMKKG
ncbi:MAG: hypothetical protein LBT26_01445 [Clostridiales Family XIII bacterium]|jgi:hypothetical protein|nr:hypothetical protein [Clostridiales Family XIII bacterium]